MYEVEVKVAADLDAVAQRLDELGATQTGDVVQVDTYYDAPHRDFAETDEALRVRRETREGDTEVRITYKGPLVEAASKTREEAETAVADGETAHSIFENLGFSPAATVEKERRFYRYEGYTVTLDDVSGVGEFVEVETETDEDGVEAAREGAFEVLQELGLDPEDQTRTSYLGLLLEDSS
ncbi:class IV adenylate cyclase [Haloarcula onubensis]|uniref:Class IV adenylate cyclase n=1 Tax=Haloarcula onubensis TaxID=2950539 RepID=A0ABU2FL30_9EURY|nr:class IV adenylate cyclase [Halomicroarcula sp. S3CR25-11]MDS0281435.1 class IV adenylate cyclase [Halomicroarcula sp. S3CR25-11]